MNLLSVAIVLALACAYSSAQDAEIPLDEAAVVVAEHSQEESLADDVGACGCVKPASAKAAFESVLKAFSQNLLSDVSSYYAPGTFTPCHELNYLQSVSFETPTYLIDLPSALVAKIGWEYQFKESSERFNDGGLVFFCSN